MTDPSARRRRHIVLAVLVVVALILVTAGFGATGGGAAGGPLGALNEGASKIAKPVRDLVNWFGDTVHAKGENKDLRAEAAKLRTENARLGTALRRFPKVEQLQKLVDDLNLKRNDPVPANVIVQSPTAWASTIGIDRGSSDGIEVDQAVVGADGEGAGLVGFVSAVRGSTATVSLLPTQGLAVGARLDNKDPILTLQGAGAGTSTDLELQYIPSRRRGLVGKLVTTSGTAPDTPELPSNAPPGLPIGYVDRVDQAATDQQVAHVRPLVDLRTLESVQVLTRTVNRNLKP